MAVEVPLTQGKIALVSECDAERVLRYNWSARKDSRVPDQFYAIRNSVWVPGAGGYQRRTTILMHRFILEAPANMVVDHKDDDGLNNTRENLRLCTHRQNLAGQRKPIGKCGFRGVYVSGRKFGARIWDSTIGENRRGKMILLGTFETAEEAARAYDAGALKRFGEFARLNFPGDIE